MAAVELNAVEMKILQHYFSPGQCAALLRNPDAAIQSAARSVRGGSSLWPDGPAYETTKEGVVLRRGLGGSHLATLRWSRVKGWVEALPDNLRATAVAADVVLSKRHALIIDHGDSTAPEMLAWQEARHVRDAAFAQCFDYQIQNVPALFEPEMPLAR